MLENPSLLSETQKIAHLPTFSIFDVGTYLIGNGVPHSSIRDHKRSEGYTMMEEGFVKRAEVAQLSTDRYWAFKTSVKPRTRDKDCKDNEGVLP